MADLKENPLRSPVKSLLSVPQTQSLTRNYHTPREHCESLGFRGKLTKVQIRDLQDFNLCFKCRGTAEPDAGKHRPEVCEGQDLYRAEISDVQGVDTSDKSELKIEVWYFISTFCSFILCILNTIATLIVRVILVL